MYGILGQEDELLPSAPLAGTSLREGQLLFGLSDDQQPGLFAVHLQRSFSQESEEGGAVPVDSPRGDEDGGDAVPCAEDDCASVPDPQSASPDHHGGASHEPPADEHKTEVHRVVCALPCLKGVAGSSTVRFTFPAAASLQNHTNVSELRIIFRNPRGGFVTVVVPVFVRCRSTAMRKHFREKAGAIFCELKSGKAKLMAASSVLVVGRLEFQPGATFLVKLQALGEGDKLQEKLAVNDDKSTALLVRNYLAPRVRSLGTRPESPTVFEVLSVVPTSAAAVAAVGAAPEHMLDARVETGPSNVVHSW
jgi:hypothetical protein